MSGFNTKDLFWWLLLRIADNCSSNRQGWHLIKTSVNLSVLINCFSSLRNFWHIFFAWMASYLPMQYHIKLVQQSCYCFSTQFLSFARVVSSAPQSLDTNLWYCYSVWNQLQFDIIWLQVFWDCVGWISLSMAVFTSYYRSLFQKHHKIHIMNEKLFVTVMISSPKPKHYSHLSA